MNDCKHPEHRRGTRGGLRSNQEVCMNCGAVVIKKPNKQPRKKIKWPTNAAR